MTGLSRIEKDIINQISDKDEGKSKKRRQKKQF